ncbi:hypothetical protein C2862_23010 [Massilia sp. Mn16-1_5]|nr:hypothetical protein C2862_23010 [Massilia sp. Mn16-1_5]
MPWMRRPRRRRPAPGFARPSSRPHRPGRRPPRRLPHPADRPYSSLRSPCCPLEKFIRLRGLRGSSAGRVRNCRACA